ncbi:MAG: type VI secretion system-associated protein TagF [Pseudomonadota bacterium]|nr:type VI secretion system-associated protein TagF [Pseudomonadota bacterium]
MTARAPAGWYGKLPTLGDFATRRLAPGFVEAWDGWLAEGLGGWRERDPEGWLPAYLDGPSWRFVLLDGVLPAAAGSGPVAGVMLPSVDRVGRYFPFTLAWPLDALPGDAAALDQLLRTLHRCDDLAFDALHEDWSVERLEQELALLADAGAAPAPAEPGRVARAGGSIGATLQRLAGEALLTHWAGCAIWLSDPGDAAVRLHVSRGLPRGGDFDRLLSGQPTTDLLAPSAG